MARLTFHSGVITVAVTALALAGCGGGGSVESEEEHEAYLRAHGIDADVRLGEDGEVAAVTIDRPGGAGVAQVGRDLDLPDGFPEDVAIYPGMSIYGANATPMGFMLSAQSPDAGADILAFYRAEMPALGWSVTELAEGEAARVARFQKGPRMAAVNVVASGGVTTLNIAILTLPE